MRWVGEDTTRVWAWRERGKDPGGREGARDWTRHGAGKDKITEGNPGKGGGALG